ncbi:hypothetical protein PTKIN_Ptkin15bG0018700 [Pterospermum kingtungense]
MITLVSRNRYGKMEEKDYYDPPASLANGPGTLRVTRDFPPAHYSFKINSFSLFSEEDSIEKYETGIFEAGGYKWRLSLYPNGNKKSNGDGFISLYLQIAETERLSLGWQINVNFKFFVFDQIRDKYLVIEDAGKRFHQMKTEWGFDQLLPLECFNDTSNGYLVDDSCVFGAEVFVIEQKFNWECLSLINEPDGNPISFKLENFSKLGEKYYESPSQSVAGFKWKLRVYPHGHRDGKTGLSLFLGLVEAPGVPPERKLHVKYKLRVMNQISSKHSERSGVDRFIAEGGGLYGYDFLSPKVLHDTSKGFLVKDALIVEADIILLSKIKCAVPPVPPTQS